MQRTDAVEAEAEAGYTAVAEMSGELVAITGEPEPAEQITPRQRAVTESKGSSS